MTRTICKFPLRMTDVEQVISVSSDAALLHVAGQDGVPCLWVELDPERMTVSWTFYIVGTGNAVPEGRIYAGTAHCPPFVWHIYRGGITYS